MVSFIVKDIIPVPEGSHSAHIVGGRAIIHHNKSDKLMAFRERVADAYRQSGGNYYHDAPIDIGIVFIFPRPKSVKRERRPQMTVKPDTDKLIRSVLDALTGVAYDDDSQVVHIDAYKIYDDCKDYHGVEITLGEMML